MTTRLKPDEEHRYMRFNPEITTGNIIQIVMLAIALGAAYGTYRDDQGKQDSEIAQVKQLTSRDRDDTQKSLAEVKTRLDKQGDQLQDIKESLAILRGRAAEPGSKR